MNDGGANAETKPKKKSALAEQREGYVTRARAKAVGRAGKKAEAEDMMSKLKAFQEKIRKGLPAGGDDAAESNTAPAKEAHRDKKPDKKAEKMPEKKPEKQKQKAEEGTFASIWEEGDDEVDKDWLLGDGLKFHVSADKAFKLKSDKDRARLEIFDPLAARGNDEMLAEERKKRSEQMRPQMRRKEPLKKW